MRRLALLLAFFVATTASAANIVDQVIAAYGGVAAWSGIDSIRETGTVSSTMRGTNGKLTRELVPPDHLRIVIDYPNESEVRIVDGRTGTRNGEAVTGPQLDAMRLQYARMDLPRLLVARRSAIIDRGEQTKNGVRVHVIEIPLPDGLALTADIDPATKHITHTTGTLSAPGGTKMSFECDYFDFTFVGERLFAMREVTTAGGVVTGETRLKKIEVRVKA